MTVKALAASALVACATWAVPSSHAADLGYGGVPSDRYSSAYEDPRYRDIYGAPRKAESYPEPEVDERAPPRRVYEPDYRPAPPRYGFAPPPRQRFACAPRREIRHQLAAAGWFDFRPVAVRPNVAVVHARRGNGELFLLNVDRCTGEVVHARPLGRFVGRPYAAGPRPWDRPYFR